MILFPQPTKIAILWHGWRLPTANVDRLRADTRRLIEETLRPYFPHAHVSTSFDEEPRRAIEFTLDYGYVELSSSERRSVAQEQYRMVSALVGDVLRYFVQLDSYHRMLRAPERYGMGSGHDEVPRPPTWGDHMQRRPPTFGPGGDL